MLVDNVDGAAAAERVREKIEGLLREVSPHGDAADADTAAGGGSVGGTVGVAAYPDAGQSAEELVRQADADMYERKRIGKAARGEPSRW